MGVPRPGGKTRSTPESRKGKQKEWRTQQPTGTCTSLQKSNCSLPASSWNKLSLVNFKNHAETNYPCISGLFLVTLRLLSHALIAHFACSLFLLQEVLQNGLPNRKSAQVFIGAFPHVRSAPPFGNRCNKGPGCACCPQRGWRFAKHFLSQARGQN